MKSNHFKHRKGKGYLNSGEQGGPIEILFAVVSVGTITCT